MDEFITSVLGAATGPESAATEAERIRERLARAGVLVERGPWHRRPDAEAAGRARHAFAGTRRARARVSVFADSSALVKLYADEPGHEQVRNPGLLLVSQLARVEVPAAIWRKHRMGELSPDDSRRSVHVPGSACPSPRPRLPDVPAVLPWQGRRPPVRLPPGRRGVVSELVPVPAARVLSRSSRPGG
jgi:hypothetical protein